jgi:hypothetical protein
LSSQYIQKFEEIVKIIETDGNYSLLRGMQKKAYDSPVFPYLGIFLTDLTFIEEGFLSFNL